MQQMPQILRQNSPKQKNICEAVGKAGTLSKKQEKTVKKETDR
mgnify:CR=1 FL=1